MPFLENGVLEENGGGGEGGGSGGSGGGSGGGGGGGGQECEESELTCNKCAVFSGGYCKGVLPKEQTFALNLLFSEVKHAFLESDSGDEERVLGLRGCKGVVDLKIEDGSPVVEFSFKSTAKVQDEENGFSPDRAKSERVRPEVLREGEQTISGLFESLFESARTLDCDIFGLRTMLYKKYYGKYERYADGLYKDATVKTNVKLKSSS